MKRLTKKEQEEEDIAVLQARHGSRRTNKYHVGINIPRSRIRNIKNGLKCFRN